MRNILFLFIIISILSCRPNSSNTGTEVAPEVEEYSLIGGKTMGTTYSVKYEGGEPEEINRELDDLFATINKSVSTYDPTSLISKINSNKKEWIDIGITDELNKHFVTNFLKAGEVYKKTNGLFDPTVMPLVNYWGFGYTGKQPITRIDEKQIATMMESVGMDKVDLITETDTGFQRIRKKNAALQLDFGAIAKGYAVDMAARLLDAKGIGNYLVEIGGEVVTKGHNPNGKHWVIGVNTPEEDAKINDFKAYVLLSGKGMATSGNYRNFYEVDGQKYSHTINPETGFPERSELLSATIIADDCMTADAYATACMVGGLEKAMSWIQNENSLDGYFIFSDKSGTLQTRYTEGFKKYLDE